jgi:signal transduction histidine kinase
VCRGLNMKISSQILLAFSIVLALSTVDTISNYLLSLKVEQNIKFLNNSQDIIRNSTRIHKSIIEMQNSFRGFLLTGDDDFLENYNKGLQVLDPLFIEQEKRVESSTQLALVKSIEQMHLQWVKYADALIVAKKNRMASSETFDRLVENKLKKKIGKNLNDSITKKFIEFDRREYKLRKTHSNNLIASIKNTHSISFILLSLTIIVGIFSTIYIIRLIMKRIRTMSKQALNIAEGDFTTIRDSHKDELTSLSDSLNTMSGMLNKNIDELEKRNAELDKFAYVVSHDLKAPLRGIHNVVKWIEEDMESELSPEMKNYLKIIPQRTQRMEALINGLLDYARIRKMDIAEKTDVKKLVDEITETIIPANFTVETRDLPVFMTDRLKLEQVFTNLINNAVKYTTAERGRIIISCKEFPGYYEFCVKDNGIGVAPEYHQKIFEIFQTLRDKHEKESTGIGLAIVKKIIDEQHGTIKINSALGMGAEFIFTWPANHSLQ